MGSDIGDETTIDWVVLSPDVGVPIWVQGGCVWRESE